MDWGLQNRLARIIYPHDGRTVMLAVDHGYFLGPLSQLEVPGRTITPLLRYADSLMLTRGILRTSVDPSASTGIVLRVSGGTSIVGEDLSHEGITTAIEEAVRLNASAVAVSIFVGSRYEHETLMNLSRMVNEGEAVGMPVLGVTAVGKELEKRDSRYLALCCRIAAELGARIVKTYYCENFEKVVEGCPVPIVIAGGPKLVNEDDVFEMAYNAVRMGAAGVDMGRNIWQHDFPVAMIAAVRRIVHHGATPAEALTVFTETQTKEATPREGAPQPVVP